MNFVDAVSSFCFFVIFYRSLGVHISKVRSVTLDSWEPEVLKVMAELGNKVVNNIYEYSYCGKLDKAIKPTSNSVK